ncbi:MAG TPA: hypothetical protein VJL35_15175 [Gemmatimonadaceae bacterium]|nr:hypothetical protein [Gemmatimonadaceae bacterium]
MTSAAQTSRMYRRPVAKKRRKTQVLKIVLIVAAIAPAFVALTDSAVIPLTTRFLSVLLWILALTPAILYLSRPAIRRRPLPFIETISFAYGMYYALPIALGEVNRAWRISIDPRDGYDVPVQLAFFGWIAMMGMYGITCHFMKGRKRPRDIAWNPRLVTKWGMAFLISGIVVNGARAIIGQNLAVGGVIQLFVSLQWLGIGLLTVLSRRNELSNQGRLVLIGGTIAAMGVSLAQGNVLPLVMIAIVIAFALWTGRPHIEARWLIAGMFVALIAVSFRGVVRDFRMVALLGTQQFTQREKLELMLKLLTNRIEEDGVVETLTWGGSQTAQRSATMDMFADVIRRTPDDVPYWKGETYYSLVGAMVPRFLWPDKPVKELGQAFGHRYRYLDPTNKSTAINLPILVEFYVNFGGAAVLMGMLLVGCIYGIVDSIVNRPGQTLVISMIGLTLLLPLLLIESDFSLVFGGLPLSGLALWGIYKFMAKSASGGRRATSARARVTPMRGALATGGENRPALPAR